jgi:hypothetical protein
VTVHADEKSRIAEGRIVQQMLVLGLLDKAMRLPQRHPFDFLVFSKQSGEINLEIKVFNELSSKWPGMLLSAEKYQAARELMAERNECRVVAQYLDCCMCFQFTNIPLPIHQASEFRADRPLGQTVMMPKEPTALLWLGTIVEYQPRIGMPI